MSPADRRLPALTRRALLLRPGLRVRVIRDQRRTRLGGAAYPGRRGRVLRWHTMVGGPTGYLIVYLYPTRRAKVRPDEWFQPDELIAEAACDWWPDGLEAGA